jgi:hypothetical protein
MCIANSANCQARASICGITENNNRATISMITKV